MAYSKKMKNRTDIERAQTAAEGVHFAFMTELGVKKLSIVGITLSLLLFLWIRDWSLLKQSFMFTGLVVFAELVNTSIEHVCDYVQPEQERMIKKAKDIAAGATFTLVCTFLLITVVDIIIILINR